MFSKPKSDNAGKKPKQSEKNASEPLDRNPATAKSKLLLQTWGPGNVGRFCVDEIFALAYEQFGDEQVPCAANIELARKYYRTHKEFSGPIEEQVREFKPSNPIHFEDQPELYPHSRQRSDGPAISVLDELLEFSSFCSYDVLQQTPEVLDMPIDQQHVVTSWTPSASNVMPDARWVTLIDPKEVAEDPRLLVTVDHGVTQVYKMQPEVIELVLRQTDRVAIDTVGRVTGINGDLSIKGQERAKFLSRKFRRTGTFDQTVVPARGDHLTPKVDGEALFLNTVRGRGEAYDRMGNRWTFSSDRTVRLLVECVPSIASVERVFLTHAWRCGTVNNVGVLYWKELLEKKEIYITIGGKRIRLEFPSFNAEVPIPSDGFVLHKGRSPFFLKDTPSVDVFEEVTKRKINESFGSKLVVTWVDGKAEYSVRWIEDKLYLDFVRYRPDKPDENDLFNILEVLNGPSIESWVIMFEENGVVRL